MLLEAAPGGLHHLHGHEGFHEDAHHGIGRHLLGHAARKRLVVSRREQAGFEPGTIVIVQARDALLHLRRRRERRVLGQVAALGMATHQERLGKTRIGGHCRQIAGRQHLGLDRRPIGHVEVLAPPGERRVGAAKAHVSEVPGAHVGRGGELQVARLIERSCVIVDEQIAETRAGSHPEQLLLHLRRVHAGEHRREQLGPHKVGEPHGIQRRRRVLGHFGSVPPRRRRKLRDLLHTRRFRPRSAKTLGAGQRIVGSNVRALLRGPQACAFTCTFARTPPQAAEQTAQLAQSPMARTRLRRRSPTRNLRTVHLGHDAFAPCHAELREQRRIHGIERHFIESSQLGLQICEHIVHDCIMGYRRAAHGRLPHQTRSRCQSSLAPP